MSLGQVEIVPFDEGENIAQYVAFAASVKGISSSLVAIENIALMLGKFTREQSSARVISVPLLGTGAGGLDFVSVVEALKRGFELSGHKDATLVVYVLERNEFDFLINNRRDIIKENREAVRVFISHTSNTTQEINWVKDLAVFLMSNGVQARLDKFHLRRGMDLTQWMCNELSLAKKVIIICDETYKMKADGRLGGVGWETMIIQGDMVRSSFDSTKYQVVVRSNELENGLPLYLKTKYAFHVKPSGDESVFREELLKELLDVPEDEELEFGV
jgi:hypothetical protein